MSSKIDLTILYIGNNELFVPKIKSLVSQSRFSIKIESANSNDDAIDHLNEIHSEYKSKALCLFNLNSPENEGIILQYVNSQYPSCKNMVVYEHKPWVNSIELLTNRSIFGMIDSQNNSQFELVLLNYLAEIDSSNELYLQNSNLKQKLKSLQQQLSQRTTELLKKNIALESLSITDKLTQINNRLKLDEHFSFNLEYCKRYNADFSIILLDIDFFKQVNDSFGHQIGDEILIKIASILTSNLRQTDMAGRWGGEEFFILCPSSNLNQASQLAEKLRNLVTNSNFDKVGQITISFGVTSFKKGDSEKSMLQRADKALYSAKEKGRNRVEELA